LGHAGSHKADGGLDGFGSGLAGELPVGGQPASVWGVAPMASATTVELGFTA